MTIRSKLILLYSGLLAIIIVGFSISLFAVTRWVLVNSVNNTLVTTANQILTNSTPMPVREFGGPTRIVLFMPALDFFRASGVFAQVWEVTEDDGFRLLGASLDGYEQPIDLAALEKEHQYFENTEAVSSNPYSTVKINGSDWRVLTVAFPYRGWQLVIQTATPFDAVNQASQALVVIIIVATMIALLASVMLGLWLANRVLQPIDDITRSAAKITSSADLKTRLQWNGPMDELGRLVLVFNGAMERLERLFSVQQRFVADVSHELRTPLTAIIGNVDLIKHYGVDDQSLEAIDSEAQRMSRLVNDLLLLARADVGELKLNVEEMDLDIVVSEAYREAKILAKDRDLKVTVADFEAVRIKGDADRLKQLLLNLLTNAIKFTPDGGQITINLRKTEYNAIIQIRDTGKGIPPEDMKRIFDRFYQVEPSRARTPDTGEGAGLGLSIAWWIAQAHGGKIDVESKVDEGTTFTIYLPHIEEPERVLSEAVTRPRLSIIRRGSPPPEKIK